MTLKFITASNFNVRLKCTVQATGKLGFTTETAEVLKLTVGRSVKFAQDDEEGQLYMVFVSQGDREAFQVAKAGNYYYLPTQAMFEALGFKLGKGRTYIYDLVRMPELDAEASGEVYKMKPREKRKRADRKSE